MWKGSVLRVSICVCEVRSHSHTCRLTCLWSKPLFYGFYFITHSWIRISEPLVRSFFSSSLFHSIFIFQKRFWCGTIRWSRIFKTAFGRCSMSHECEFWATPNGGSLKFCLILVFCECVLIFFSLLILSSCSGIAAFLFLLLGTIQTDKWFIW